MISPEKIHKISKYTFKIKKSFENNNYSDYINYCNHLKYHMGNNKEFYDIFDKLIISTNKYELETLINKNNVNIKKLQEKNINLDKINKTCMKKKINMKI